MLQWALVRYATGDFLLGVLTAKTDAGELDQGGSEMRFMLMVYLDEEVEARKSASERDEMLTRCLAHSAEWKRRGVMDAGEVLLPTSLSTTVRVRGGEMLLTDGPFAETKEQLGGYYIVRCANEEEALRLAADLSEIHGSSAEAIEVRPIHEIPKR